MINKLSLSVCVRLSVCEYVGARVSMYVEEQNTMTCIFINILFSRLFFYYYTIHYNTLLVCEHCEDIIHYHNGTCLFSAAPQHRGQRMIQP